MNSSDMVSDLKVRFYFRNGCVLVLLVFLLIGCGQMKAGMKDMNTYLNDLSFTPRSETVTAESLNLRTSPSVKSKIITQLKKEEQVTISGQDGRWVKVKTKSGQRGWVYSAYLTGFDPPVSNKTVQTTKNISQQQSDKDPIKAQEKKITDIQAGTKTVTSKDPDIPQVTQAYAHPHNQYRLEHPTTWQLEEDYSSDPNIVKLTAPSTKAEFWIISTSTQSVETYDKFYLSLVRPLAKQFGDAVEIEPLGQQDKTGQQKWYYGRAIVNQPSKTLYKYSLVHFNDTFWSLVMVVKDGILPQNIDSLNAIHDSFSPIQMQTPFQFGRSFKKLNNVKP